MINGLNKQYYKTARCKKSVYASTANHELNLERMHNVWLARFIPQTTELKYNIRVMNEGKTRGRLKGVIEAEEPIEARLFWAAARNHPNANIGFVSCVPQPGDFVV